MKKSLSVLTVLGKDRPGIIASVTEILFRQGCNLEDISMTVLEGEFAMIMVVCLDGKSKEKVDGELVRLRNRTSLEFFWKDFKGKGLRGDLPPKGMKTFLISAIGRDRTGIVFKVSQILAKHGVNITDLNSKILGEAKQKLYAMVLEADIPQKVKTEKLEKVLNQLAKSLKIEIKLRPFERIEF